MIEASERAARRDRAPRRRTRRRIDMVELDLRGVLGYTDYFLVCSGNTGRQAKAIHDGILEGLKREHGSLPRRVEGSADAGWILMDYLDVVVHIFTPDARASTASSSSGERRRPASPAAPARTVGPGARAAARRRPPAPTTIEPARAPGARSRLAPGVAADHGGDARRRARHAARAVLRPRLRAGADAVHGADRAHAHLGRRC